MACERYTDELVAAAAAGDAETQSPQLRAHLESCADCRAELGSLRVALKQADEILAAQAAVEPSPEFFARVRRRIAEEPVPSPWWHISWRPAAGLALAGALLAFVWIGMRDHQPSPVVSSPKPQAPIVRTNPPPEPISQQVANRVPSPTTPIKVARVPHEHESSGPKVLVPRGELENVLQLYRAAWSGAPAEVLLTASVSASEPQPQLKPAPLEIAPLEMKPLVPVPNAKGSESSGPKG